MDSILRIEPRTKYKEEAKRSPMFLASFSLSRVPQCLMAQEARNMISYTTLLHTLNAKVIAANKSEYFLNKYKNLHTDEERIIFALTAMQEFSVIPRICGDMKDVKESAKLREQGNKIFISSPLTNTICIEALKLYNKSICYAPYPSEQLSLAYGNRSAVLIKLRKYKECIKDIERALEWKCTDNIRAKLYMRKIECLSALQDPTIDGAIKEVQCFLEKMSLDNAYRKKLNEKLGSTRTKALSHEKSKQDIRQLMQPTIWTYNTEVPCASDAVDVRYDDIYGRHVVATRDISPGEAIALEPPYCQLLAPDNVHTHCSYCFKVSWASIPCSSCTYVMYCSEECKTLDFKKYHDIECAIFPILSKMECSKIDMLSLRLAIKAVREAASIADVKNELKEVDSWADPRTKGFSRNGIFESSKYRSVLGLATNTEKRSARDMFRRSIDSCIILYLVATRTNMFGDRLANLSELLENADVTFFGSLILRHQQMIPTNVHTSNEENGTESIEHSIVVLPFHSLCNHSCTVDTIRYSTPEYEVSLAVRPIKKGEQIFQNYGQHFALTPIACRQEVLLKNHYFKCNCIACRNNWPTYNELESYKSVVKCKETVNTITLAMQKYMHDITTGDNITDTSNVGDLIKMINIMYDLVPGPCLELLMLEETLRRVYASTGNQFELPDL